MRAQNRLLTLFLVFSSNPSVGLGETYFGGPNALESEIDVNIKPAELTKLWDTGDEAYGSEGFRETS
jgi:hypothetical protein